MEAAPPEGTKRWPSRLWEKAAKGGETLTVMCVGTEADSYIDYYNAVAEKFSENNEYGVTVKIDFYENEQYKTKLTTLMASNAVPDIFFTWELSYLQPFVEGGKVVDITSYLNEDEEWKNSFADGTLDLVAYDGEKLRCAHPEIFMCYVL